MGILIRPTDPTSIGEHAAQLLRGKGRTVHEVIRVNPDCILYLGASKRPMIAWLHYDDGRLELQYEAGWPAWPAEHLLPKVPDTYEGMDQA